jgi:CheY-like chemotaxis protein
LSGAPVVKLEIALYYYPTNVVFIDDNEIFLSSLTQVLELNSPHLNYNIYSDPVEALQEVNHNYNKLSENQSISLDAYQLNASQFIFDILNKGHQLKSRDNRPEEISVLVVDLDMPELDGIEFCKQVKSPNVKKILLTGVKDMDRVITAFNDSDINFYINKGDDNIESTLQQAIAQLQYEYFLDITSKVKSEAISGSTSLFNDPAFSDYFIKLRQSLDIKEFYFEPYPARYNLESIDGSKSILLVYSEDEIEEHLQVMKEENAPEHLINALVLGEVPYFSTADGFFEAQHPDASRWVTFKSTVVQGKQLYRCALVDQEVSKALKTIRPHRPNNTVH